MSTSYACSDASARRDEPMFATGSQVRGWLLIEVRGAWGEDAIHASAFGEHVPRHWKDELKRRHIRAVCIRSHLTSRGARRAAVRLRRPPARHRTGAAVATRRRLAGRRRAPRSRRLRVDRTARDGWERVQESLILVCTNGRHDQCCANLGRPLVRALRDSPWADRVWECSHIGGDRFAANVVVLPDSLYFGRVDPESPRRCWPRSTRGASTSPCSAGAPRSRSPSRRSSTSCGASSASTPSTAWSSTGEPPTARFRVRLADRLVHVRVSDGWCRSPSR